jgi:hypothetical protein
VSEWSCAVGYKHREAPRLIRLSLSSQHKVNLHLGDLSRPMADNIPDVLTDMLEIAAYVYCRPVYETRHRTDDEHGCRLAPQVPVQGFLFGAPTYGQGQRS